MTRSRRPLLAAVLALAVPAVAVAGPPLADRVPADTMVYFGWAGADNCPGYDGSRLQALVADSAAPDLGGTFVPQLVRRMGMIDQRAGQVLDRVFDTAGPMWHHPTAIYFAGIATGVGGRPVPRLTLICDAGPDAGALSAQLEWLVAELPADAQPTPTVTTEGSLVTLAFAMDNTPAKLASAGPFTAALAQCKPDGAAVVGYVDLQRCLTAIDDAIAKGGNADVVRAWPKARQALGLSGMRRFAMTAGFDGRDWVERAYASTDGSKQGLLSLFDARPLDADLLSVVPKTADRVSASRLDLAAGFDALQEAVRAIDLNVGQQFDGIVNRVDQTVGMNVRRDLLGSLGDQWVTYADRTIGGTGVAGSVLVNRLRDPAKADAAMTLLATRLNRIIAHAMPTPNVEVQFREQTTANGTVTLHYLAVPLVTPTWAVHNGSLYVALYPQVVAAAVDEADHHATGASILQRPEFVAVRHRLGDRPASSLSFVDLPAVAPDGYADLLATTRLYLGLGDIIGAHPPAMVLPPLRQLIGRLTPAGSAAWADTAGWHSMAVSPFPGAEIVTAGGGGGGAIYQQFMLMSMFGQMGNMRR